MSSAEPVVIDLTILADAKLLSGVLYACRAGRRTAICAEEDLYSLIGFACGYVPDYHTGDDHLGSITFYRRHWSEISQQVGRDTKLNDPGAPLALASQALTHGWLRTFSSSFSDAATVDHFLSLPDTALFGFRDWDGSLRSFLNEHVDWANESGGLGLLTPLRWWKAIHSTPDELPIPSAIDTHLRMVVGELLQEYVRSGNYIDAWPVTFMPALCEALLMSLSGTLVHSLDGTATPFSRSHHIQRILRETSWHDPKPLDRLIDADTSMARAFKGLGSQHRVGTVIDVIGEAESIELYVELMASSKGRDLHAIVSLSGDTALGMMPWPAKFFTELVRIAFRRKRTRW